jgi:hypothetical protein
MTDPEHIVPFWRWQPPPSISVQPRRRSSPGLARGGDPKQSPFTLPDIPANPMSIFSILNRKVMRNSGNDRPSSDGDGLDKSGSPIHLRCIADDSQWSGLDNLDILGTRRQQVFCSTDMPGNGARLFAFTHHYWPDISVMKTKSKCLKQPRECACIVLGLGPRCRFSRRYGIALPDSSRSKGVTRETTGNPKNYEAVVTVQSATLGIAQRNRGPVEYSSFRLDVPVAILPIAIDNLQP